MRHRYFRTCKAPWHIIRPNVKCLLWVGSSHVNVQHNMNEQHDSDATLIRAARAAQTAAIASGDFETVASFWTEDITVRRALGQSVSGVAEALAALTPDDDASLVYQREVVSVEVSTHWPLAFEEGRWSGHPCRAQADPVIGGRYAAQWVKQDGRWLIRAEVFVALTGDNPEN
jgi:ketosteroid isomerase-like protein